MKQTQGIVSSCVAKAHCIFTQVKSFDRRIILVSLLYALASTSSNTISENFPKVTTKCKIKILLGVR